MRNPRLALACLVLSFSALGARADGPNLLTNASFKSSLNGWNKSTSSTLSEAFVRTDFKGNPSSGSAKLVNSDTFHGQFSGLDQCVPATPGTYVLRASAWVSGGNGDSAALAVSFYSGAGCTHPLASASTPYATAKAWTPTATLAVAPAGTVSAAVNIDTGRGAGAQASVPLNAYVDDVYLGTSKCAPGTTSLCLLHGRFKVSATWTATSQPLPFTGTAVSLSDNDTTFWFTSASAPDLDVRILNGCALTNTFWVFAGGLVSEGAVALTVTDTTTGAFKLYQNSAGTTFAPLQDTAAFVCP